jgi:hypothetical protein
VAVPAVLVVLLFDVPLVVVLPVVLVVLLLVVLLPVELVDVPEVLGPSGLPALAAKSAGMTASGPDGAVEELLDCADCPLVPVEAAGAVPPVVGPEGVAGCWDVGEVLGEVGLVVVGVDDPVPDVGDVLPVGAEGVLPGAAPGVDGDPVAEDPGVVEEVPGLPEVPPDVGAVVVVAVPTVQVNV